MRLFFALLLAAGLVGCGKQAQPRHIVILIDVSGSIDRQALDQAFGAIDDLVGHLNRGDRIAIIPILGDAEAQASGRIIRFEVPISRQAYDSDLKAFRKKLKTSLATMEAEAVAHPGAKTDILGSIELAAQEFQHRSRSSGRGLIILSDFIQEDEHLDFRKNNELNGHSNAKSFAVHFAKMNHLDLSGANVYLGLLRSGEYIGLSKQRRSAIVQFWTAYFESGGGHTTFANDGSGLLENSISVD